MGSVSETLAFMLIRRKFAVSLTGLTKVAKQYFLYPAKKLLLYLG